MQPGARTGCSVSNHACPISEGLSRAAIIEPPLGYCGGIEGGDAVAHVWGCWSSHGLTPDASDDPFLTVSCEYDDGRRRAGCQHCNGSGVMASETGLGHENMESSWTVLNGIRYDQLLFLSIAVV